MPLTWIECSLLTALLGAGWSAAATTSEAARRRALFWGALSFLTAALAMADFYWIGAFAKGDGFALVPALAGRGVLGIDELNAPLLPLGALVFLVTMLATLHTKVRRFSFARTLFMETLVLATLSSQSAWLLVALLVIAIIPPALELRARRQPLRLYLIHMTAFALLLVAGLGLVRSGLEAGYLLLAIGVAIRCGLFPFHCWVTSFFERGALGTALLLMAPLTGVYACLRLLLPGAPAALLETLALAASFTALYAAAMASVQTRARRFFCFIFLSHSSLVLAGITFHDALSLTGSLSLWISVTLAMTGLGITLRSLEARTGRLSLREFLGLYSQTPTLAAFFLITGLAAVGFPGTIGFFGAEMLIDGAGSIALPVGVIVIITAALNGISIVRTYSIIFLGARYPGTVDLSCRRSERLAILALTALLLGGSFWPQPGIDSRSRAAAELLRQRTAIDDPASESIASESASAPR